MKIIHAVLAAALASLAFAAAPAREAAAYQVQTATLTGEWTGVYAGSGNTPTEFHATLAQTGPRVTGSIFEYNGFGSPDAVFLTSTVSGTAQGAVVRFTKTYDGTGGQTHSVVYEGRIASAGRRLVGEWSASGVSGTFEMVR